MGKRQRNRSRALGERVGGQQKKPGTATDRSLERKAQAERYRALYKDRDEGAEE